MQSYMHMRCHARQLDSYSTARHCSTARQLDRTRQNSTDLDTQAHGVSLDRLDKARQELDRNSTGSTGKASTAPRQRLDGASTARQLDSQGSIRDTNDRYTVERYRFVDDRPQFVDDPRFVDDQDHRLRFVRSATTPRGNPRGAGRPTPATRRMLMLPPVARVRGSCFVARCAFGGTSHLPRNPWAGPPATLVSGS